VLDPPRVSVDEGALVLSHLTFHADHPERLVTVLSMAVQMAVRTVQRERGEVPARPTPEVTRDVIAAVVRADAEVVASVRTDLGCGGPMRTMLDDALDLHLAVMAETMDVLEVD
jgi:hypothetical protein